MALFSKIFPGCFQNFVREKFSFGIYFIFMYYFSVESILCLEIFFLFSLLIFISSSNSLVLLVFALTKTPYSMIGCT